jgi:hypothetical protein
MKLLVNNYHPVVAISQNGEPIQPLTFALELTEQEVEQNLNYNLELRISRNGGKEPLWRASDPFATRSEWGSHAIRIPVKHTHTTVKVDERWWRDLARNLKPDESIEVTCRLHWEGDSWLEPQVHDPPLPAPQTVTLRSALVALTLAKLNSCSYNDDPSGRHGFSHHQQVCITALNGARYAIIQWMQGIIIKWREPPVLDSHDPRPSLGYRYLDIRSCGYDVSSYSPVYIPDGSKKSQGWPHFFSLEQGAGIDKPGDPPGDLKAWGEYDRDLMLFQFQTQVYLACDIDAGTQAEVAHRKDALGESYKTHANCRFSSSKFMAELSAAELPWLASGAWFAGILQKKDMDHNRASAVESPVAALPLVPQDIQTLIRAVFPQETELPRVVMWRV